MEFSSYFIEFSNNIQKRRSILEERTFEDYLATFADFPPLLERSEKCAITAEVSRNKGNDAFKIGSYKPAAMLYTCSIRNAPPYSKCAALAYANRSAALYHLNMYEECVLDIDRALDLPYPDDLRVKIISRKEAALSNIKKFKEAALSDIKKATSQKTKTTLVHDLKFAHGENAKLPGVSHGIDVVYCSSEKRPQLVANMPFEVGDGLVIEKPYMTVVEQGPTYRDPTYCFHCLKETLCLIPCDKCNIDVYCSEKCRMAAYENYHRIECKIQSTLIAATASISDLLKLLRCLNILTEQGTNLYAVLEDIKEIEQSSNPEKHGLGEEQFIGNTKKRFLSSSYNETLVLSPGCYFGETYIAVLLRNHTDFFKTNADILTVAKLLLKLRTPFHKNNVIIPYYGYANAKARGVYPVLNLLSHLCINNTITYQDNNGMLVLRASQKIKPGDQIFFDYIGLHDINVTTDTIFIESTRFWRTTHICMMCDKNPINTLQKYSPIKMDKKLRAKLQKNPYDITGLWELLNIVHENHNLFSFPVRLIKMLLADAYDGRHNSSDAE